MNDEDPARAFFPDEDEPDLYGCLGLSDSPAPSVDEIKKAYRRLALQHHPDKAGSNESEQDKEKRVQEFHKISFAYTILGDEKRRKRFDDTGRTDELPMFEDEADWSAYFKELWQGEVNGKTLDEFVKTYKGSAEERADILTVYTEHKGSLGALFENVMVSNVLDDEARFIDIIESAIKSKQVEVFPQWKKDIKDSKGREKRKKEAKSEAKEAEELAKELGVHDKLFGNGNGKEEKTKKGKKATSKVNDEGVDEDALKALIQSRNSKQNSMNSLIERLEAKYGAADEPKSKKKSSAKGKKKGKGRVEDDVGEEEEEEEILPSKAKKGKQGKDTEPTDEEFEALQKKLFGEKEKKSSGSGGSRKKACAGDEEGDDDDTAAAQPEKKKLRRSRH